MTWSGIWELMASHPRCSARCSPQPATTRSCWRPCARSQRAAYRPRQLVGPRAEEGRSLVLAGRVLELAREVRLDRMWSAPELGRAARAADSRVARAIERAGEFGVAQY